MSKYGLKRDLPEALSSSKRIDMIECFGDRSSMLLRKIYLAIGFYLASYKVISYDLGMKTMV